MPTPSELGGGPSLVSINAGPIAQGPFADGTVPIEQENPSLDNEQDKLLDFNQARVHLKRIIDDWSVEVEDTDVRRKTRDVEIDVEGLRQKGDLDEDETIIPVRVIDTNIQREQPPYINYLKNSRRLCTFRSLSIPDQDPQKIEAEFTRGMTYTGWETAHFKCLDGAQTHGWSCIEVVYDETKPLNVGLEYVAHDELYWPRSCKKLQDSPRIIRAYDVTISKLRQWVREFGFEAAQVDKLASSRKDTQKESETLKIYKLYFKKEGVVNVAWFALTDGVDDWLKKPDKMVIGISEKSTGVPSNTVPMPGMQQNVPPQEQYIPSDVKQYPIFLLPYRETEKPKEVDHRGRVFLDEPKQEGQTAILSGFVNGLTRSSNVYSCPDQDDGTGASLKELEDVKLVGGRIMSKPMKFFTPPYPDPMVINVMKYFDTSNSEETNQVNFAAMNREDSRKTAKEIGAAQQQQSLLNSVQLTLFSTFIREIYSFCWLIVQSQALEGNIVFLLIQVPDEQQMQQIAFSIQQQVAAPMMQAQQMGDAQTIMGLQNQQQMAIQKLQQNPPLKWINDQQTISQKWEVRAAGDVDVIQRQEKIQQMKQDWPVIANTPLANRFLTDLVKLEYPDVGEQYASILEQAPAIQQAQQLSAGLATILIGVIKQHPEIMNTISPQEQQQLKGMISQAMASSGKQPGEEIPGQKQQKQIPQQASSQQ